MRKLAILLALLWAGPALAQTQATSYFQLSQTPNYLANGGPGFVQIDANGHPFIAASVPGSGTVTNSANLANNAMVVGDGGGAGIKTVGGSIAGSFTTGGAISFTGAANGSTFALPAGGPFTFTYPLATSTLASLAGTETLTNKTYSGGVLSGTFSGTPTYSGVPKFTGLSAGTQVACLGLDSSNNLVLLLAGCSAGGGGSVSITSLSPNIVLVPSPLTGTGTIASTVPLNTQSGNAGYTIVASDAAKVVNRTNTVTQTDPIPQATGSFGSGFGFNYQTGTVGNTLTSTTSTINGIAGATGIKTGAQQQVAPFSDGTNWHVGLGVPQPPTQTGTTVLADNMTWVTLTGGSVSVSAGTPDIVITPNPGTGTFTVGTTLAQNVPTDGGSHSYTVLSSDIPKEISLVSTFTTLVVPQATGSFTTGAQFVVCNSGAITATSTTSTINGIAGATGMKFGALACSRWISSQGQWIVQEGVPTDPTQRSTAYLAGDGSYSVPAGGSGTIIANSIGGCTLSRSSATVIAVSACTAADSTNAAVISAGAFTKSVSGAWTSGTGNNGMGNGLTVANTTWYHVCAANNGGTADFYIDTSATCANRPAGISDTKVRRVGSFITNGSAQIVAFTQRGDLFIWDLPFVDVSNATIVFASATLKTLTVPLGVNVEAYMMVYNGNTSGAIAVWDPALSNASAVAAYGRAQAQSGQSPNSGQANVTTNTSSQVNVQATAGADIPSVYITTYMYRDFRGQ